MTRDESWLGTFSAAASPRQFLLAVLLEQGEQAVRRLATISTGSMLDADLHPCTSDLNRRDFQVKVAPRKFARCCNVPNANRPPGTGVPLHMLRPTRYAIQSARHRGESSCRYGLRHDNHASSGFQLPQGVRLPPASAKLGAAA